jgi:hypothetical protein
MSIGFIIPTCCKEEKHLRQLKRCIYSIRQFYKNVKIILINDSINNYNLQEQFKCDENILVYKSLNKGSADQQIFKIFYETTYFNKAIFIQDSMILNKKLPNMDNIINIQFIWHFTNHIKHWDLIKEPLTNFNKMNNINTHTDLIRHHIINNYNHNKDFQQYALNKLINKHEWVGCFGSLCIITKEALFKLNNTVNFIDIFIACTTNRNRRVNESIFSLICHYVYPEKDFANSFDGLYYDGYNVNKFNGTKTNFDNLVWCCKNNYISKIAFNR